MKRILLYGIFCFWVSGISAQQPKLSNREKKEGWILLFDGKTFNGWKRANGQPFTGKGWEIENGVLSVNPRDGRGGDIVTDQEFSDFDLSVEFKLEKGTNSGIKYFLLPNTSLGCEYQIIDDAVHPDAKLGLNHNRTLGSFYDVIPAPKNKPVKPVGSWNTVRIVAKGNRVQHWLNGKKLIEYERGSDAFEKAIALSKFKSSKGFGLVKQSPILLQEHEDVIHFRNIKIKKL